MATDNEDIVEFAEFLGLRNVGTPERYELGSLTEAQNVEVNDTGALLRRRGYTAPKISAVVHSLFQDSGVLFGVVDNDLCEIRPDYSRRVLRSGLVGSRQISYAPYAGKVYYSNGVEMGVVDGGENRSWGIDPPIYQPMARAIDGFLPPGRYSYAVTYQRSDGQISGTGNAEVIELASRGGIEFYGFPVPTDASVAAIDLWLSGANGTQLYRAGTFPDPVGTARVREEPPPGAALTTQFMGPPPAGDVVSTHGASLLVSVGGSIWQSMPYQPELFDVAHPARFSSGIVMHASVEGGVYLGMETHVVFISGFSVLNGEVRTVSEIGVIPGSQAVCPMSLVTEGSEEEGVIFALKDGSIVLGSPSGQLVNLTRDRFLIPTRDRAAAIVRTHRGMQQFVVVLRGAEKPASV